jgi:CxxC motif-containing protein (DUF1111 family)
MRVLVALGGLLVASAAAVGIAAIAVDADEERPGGDTTVFANGKNAFSFPAANLDEEGRTRFAIGNSFFRRNWVEAPSSTAARDGLGPHFIARSCGGCHDQGGRGAPPVAKPGQPPEQPVSLLFRLSIPGQGPHGAPNPDPVYGDQLNNSAVQGVKPEGKINISYKPIPGRYADGERYTLRAPEYRITDLGYGPLPSTIMIGPRVASQLIGLGLIEAIPESEILANAKAQAARPDAIKGVPNYAWDEFARKMLIGRFDWKANSGSLAQQTAAAFHGDIGITSTPFPDETCTPKQTDCLAAPRGGNKPGKPEIDDETLHNVIFYQSMLAPPARRNFNDPLVRKGQALFADAQCAACHRPSYVTGMPQPPAEPNPTLAHQKIYPYTDLLLHDMGRALADGRPDFGASGRQWRTPPLWGIGLIPDVNGHSNLLHDGRARNVSEAILWHGGEAEQAKQRFVQMSRDERKALVKFVESL